MDVFLKFIFIFNRRIFVLYNIFLYGLLVYVYNTISKKVPLYAMIYLALVILVIFFKGISELSNYKKETGLLKLFGTGGALFFILRTMEKAVTLLVSYGLLYGVDSYYLKSAFRTVYLKEYAALFCIEVVMIMLSLLYYFFSNINSLLKQE